MTEITDTLTWSSYPHGQEKAKVALSISGAPEDWVIAPQVYREIYMHFSAITEILAQINSLKGGKND